MALASGTRFGSYEIGDAIGAGGMGEVYRATDTTLERDVAIKVLPASFADDADRVTRFEREAKTLASLNHPNIAQIFGLEKSDDTTALVMELVEGPTLEDRISDGPIRADEALGIAMQIADALEAAHDQNIVHRDLKPANVKVRADGTVKVLDFGIAKALAPENLTSGPQSPIMTTPATQVGVILGTAAYMSPEQAKGKQVDQRTDIWAFGCVLYEMLTGQLAFGAEDVPTTLARVIANDTNLDSLPAAVSPAVRQAIALCLQKDAKKRIADIRDVKHALEGNFETSVPHAENTAAAALPIWRRALPVAVAILVTSVFVGFAGEMIRPAAEPPPVNRFDYDLPAGQLMRNTGRPVIALSPDGRQFVYNTQAGLYLRRMGELDARLIPGTEPALTLPAFSPDGQSVAYADDATGQLRRIAISGGAPVRIANLPGNLFGVNWTADGTVFFGLPGGIARVSANGGTLEFVIPAESGTFLYGPELLPDGDLLLFSVAPPGQWDAARIVVQSLATGERSVLIEGGYDARYLPTGHLVYALGDTLFAVAFDLDSLTVSGGAVPLVQGITRADYSFTGAANYGISANGTLVYVAGGVAAAERTLVWVDRDGREAAIDMPPRNYTFPRISPDGSKVALDVRDQELDIWTWDLTRETLTRLTFDPGEDEFPVWSPDSQRIAYSSSREGGSAGDTGLFWQAADGTGSIELLAESEGQIFPVSFLPDATGILVRGTVTRSDDDVSLVQLQGGSGATPLLETTFAELNPEISPDGNWLAYTSNESGSNEVYVRPFPEIDAGRWQVSTEGGVQPLWARSGNELFYRNGEAVMAVPIETNPGFTAGNPEVVFEGRYFIENDGRSYDVSLDGEQFLMIRQVEDISATPQIIIVENWFEELERLVPTE